jgi:hypothetical protein
VPALALWISGVCSEFVTNCHLQIKFSAVPRQDLISLGWPKSELKHHILQMTFVTLTP